MICKLWHILGIFSLISLIRGILILKEFIVYLIWNWLAAKWFWADRNVSSLVFDSLVTTQSVNREKRNTDKCLVKYGDLKIRGKRGGLCEFGVQWGREFNQQGFTYRAVREKGCFRIRGCVTESMGRHHLESRAQARLGHNGDQRQRESSTCWGDKWGAPF